MFTLEELLQSMNQPAQAAAHGAGVAFGEAVIDSRLVREGSLFVALPGAHVDGHTFVAQALASGAKGALVSRAWAQERGSVAPEALLLDPAQPLSEPPAADAQLLLLADDPLEALHGAARHKRSLVNPTVVGITGSVGKTSTKELTAALLHTRFGTLKNPRSYNNEATMPLTLLQLASDHEVVVLEMGMWAPGEIALLCDLAQPQLGVVTNVGPSHLERMGSLEAIARAKGELPRALPAGGVAILNIDDPLVRAMATETAARPFFYGLDAAADLRAEGIESRGLQGISFWACYRDERMHLKLPLLGRHSVYTALAAIAVGLLLGMSWDEITTGLSSGEAEQRLVAVPGIGGAQLIDDTYNASPVSVLAALNLLSELDGRRVVVLGDMLELGNQEESGHREVGRRVADVADLLLACGQRARAYVADEARQAGMPPEAVIEADDNEAAVALLRPILRQGDYVLVKGSRGQAMEAIVAALARRPDHEEHIGGGS